MLNNLLKIGALVVTGRFLKPRIKGLLVLLAFWFVIRLLHAEYISYVELSADTSFLWQASLLKIVLYVLGFVIYFFSVERRLLLESKNLKDEKLMQARNEHIERDDDGFNFLREKPKLENKADQLLRK
jgi:predicted membrane protein